MKEASEGGLKEASEGGLKEASEGSLKEASEGGLTRGRVEVVSVDGGAEDSVVAIPIVGVGSLSMLVSIDC